MAKKLLVIEGEEGISGSLQTFLGSKGYVVFLADNVREGLELLDSRHIAGVLLSLDMLDISDLQVLNDLRSQYPQIPVISMSWSPSRKLLMQAFAGGVRGHISKPIVHEQLREALFIFEGHLC